MFTTTVFGYVLDQSFLTGIPLTVDEMFSGYSLLWSAKSSVLPGLLFSAPLLLILSAHELGHYFTCREWNVRATLPYFLPAPTLIGTFGAFIRIKSPIYTRKSLFDIGVSGPIAGFLVLIPFLIAGIALSRVVPSPVTGGDFVFGTPLLMRLVEWCRFPGVPAARIVIHPMARAAWAGLLATSINLLPIGQLDGGHILYSLFGQWHTAVSRIFVASLLPLGLFYYKGWLLWAVVLFALGMRHPLVYDSAPLDRKRKWLAAAALLILILSFSPAPVDVH